MRAQYANESLRVIDADKQFVCVDRCCPMMHLSINTLILILKNEDDEQLHGASF